MLPRTTRLSCESLEPREVPATWKELPIIPELDAATRDHLLAIRQQGAANGNRSDVFMKVGDSITFWPESIGALGRASFNPATSGLQTFHPGLVDTWQTYQAPVSGGNSFSRNSLVAQMGNSTANVVAGLSSEIATIRPAIALIEIGTNDQVFLLDAYPERLRQIIETCLTEGVIPVLATIPRPVYYGQAGIVKGELVNQTIAEVAAEYDVPVWNFWRSLESLPNFGLHDGVHPNAAPAGGGQLTPDAMLYGYNVRNLNALQILDQLRDQIFTADLGPVTPETPWQPLQSAEHYVAIRGVNQHRIVIADSNGNAALSINGISRGGDAAVGDVNGDGIPDVILSASRGVGPMVQARDGRDGAVLWQFFAYEESFRGGVEIAVGNLDGDAHADIVVAPASQGGPLVRAFRGSDRSEITSFFAFEPTFRGGLQISLGDVDGTAVDEIVVGAGFGGAPLVRVFDAMGADRDAFFAYESSLRSGVYVDVADINGDGRAEILTGPRSDGPRIQAFESGNREPIVNAFLDDPNGRKGAMIEFVPGTQPSIWVSSGKNNVLKRWSIPELQPLDDLSIPLDSVRRLDF